jgi:hypothetical protein
MVAAGGLGGGIGERRRRIGRRGIENKEEDDLGKDDVFRTSQLALSLSLRVSTY